MKVLCCLVLIAGAIAPFGTHAEAPGGPYSPSGWKPQGQPFDLPNEQPPAQPLNEYGAPVQSLNEYGAPLESNVEITQENIQHIGDVNNQEQVASSGGTEYGVPDEPQNEPTEEEAPLTVQGLPDQDPARNFNGPKTSARLRSQNNQFNTQNGQLVRKQNLQNFNQQAQFVRAPVKQNTNQQLNFGQQQFVQSRQTFQQPQNFNQRSVAAQRQQQQNFGQKQFRQNIKQQPQQVRNKQNFGQQPQDFSQQQFVQSQQNFRQQPQNLRQQQFNFQQPFAQNGQFTQPQRNFGQFGRLENAVPQTEYGYPAAETTPIPDVEESTEEATEVPTEEPEQSDKDEEYDDGSEGSPNVAIANSFANGQYYILLPNNQLQKVNYVASQSRDDEKNKGFTAQLRYENVDPIRDPIYSYDAQGQLIRIFKK